MNKEQRIYYSMKVKVEKVGIFTSVYIDKLPIQLVHTAEWIFSGLERKCNFLVYDKKN